MGQTMQMADIIQTLNNRNFAMKTKLDAKKREAQETGEFLIYQAEKLHFMLEQGYELWDDDKKELLEIVNGMED